MAVTKAQIGAHDALNGVSINDIVVVGEQVALIAALTDSSGGTASGTLAAISATYVQTEIRNSIASLNAKIAAILVALKAHGLVASV